MSRSRNSNTKASDNPDPLHQRHPPLVETCFARESVIVLKPEVAGQIRADPFQCGRENSIVRTMVVDFPVIELQ
jgi:hypothetical protein